jgi:hypothetical protein
MLHDLAMDFPPYILSIVAIVLFMIYVLQRDTHLFEKIHRKLLGSESRPLKSSTDPTATIQALWDFDITTTPPISYRPYEFQGHVTMGIQQRKRQDWIRMDNGYSQRIRDRKEPLTAQPHYTIGTGPLLDPAIEELYHEIMVDYLPKRYPTLFSEKGGIVQNRVTGSSYPLSTSNLSPKSMLELLGENVEEDFYFMCPDAEDGQFRLRGYVTCFPGGFLSPERVGESVREIHRPVPGYEEKIGKSVDRYSKRMVPGQFIGRINVSLRNVPNLVCGGSISVREVQFSWLTIYTTVVPPGRQPRPVPY